MSSTTTGGGRRRRAVLAGAAAGVALACYGGAAWAVADEVPAGTRVAGVDVGGQSRDEAVTTLEQELVPRLAEPVPVTVADVSDQVDPVEAGMRVDLAATVDDLVGFSLDPRDLLAHVTGEQDADVVTTADRDALDSSVEQLAARVDTAPTEGAITFADGKPVPVTPAEGLTVDVDAAADALLERWPASGSPIPLPATVTEPTVTQDEVDEAMTSFAVPAMSGPFTVVVGDIPTTLPPTVVAGTLSMQPRDGNLVPVVDGEALKKAVLEANPALQSSAQNAVVRLEGGKPVVVPAANGATIDPAALAEAAVTGLASPDRTATLETAVAEPEVTTAEAEALGVKEVVSQFATTLTADAARTENIQIAARTINGTLLLPGETFSMNGVLGRRTPEKGYNAAPVIMNGRLTKDYGGGVSQVATTLFNGMFFAGLEDVEHKPHSFYISRYPEGREATVNYPTIDLKFTNDSKYGVLIEMWTGGGQVHTRFWSTKVWQVDAVKSERRNLKQPEVIVDDSEGCVAQSPQPGFDVTVTRIFKQGGAEKKRETFRTHYIPEDKVTCVPPQRTTPTPTPSPSPSATTTAPTG